MIDFPTAVWHLALALAFGAVIGVEREWRQKQAGLKTMSLVALGAAAFSIVSDTFGEGNRNPGQIAAAVVGGIGFLGAGLILRRGPAVHGLTTAATLWASASVGVAVGLDEIPLATTLTALVVAMQVVGRSIEQRIRRFRRRDMPGRYELRVESSADALHAVNETWAPYGPPVTRTVQRGLEGVVVRVVLRAREPLDVSVLEEQMARVDGVRRIDVHHLGVEEEP